MKRSHLYLIIAASVFAGPATSTAQTVTPPGLGLGGTVGAITVSPEIEAREWGIHYEGYLRYALASGFQVVGGIGYSLTDIDQEGIKEKRSILSFFVDPRFALRSAASRFTPYLGGRIAYAHHSLKTPFLGLGVLTRSGDGWMFGGALGVLARLSQQAAFEANLTIGVAPFGDYELIDEIQDGTSSSEYFGSLRIGLIYSFSAKQRNPEQ
jgi:hypothetical protein